MNILSLGSIRLHKIFPYCTFIITHSVNIVKYFKQLFCPLTKFVWYLMINNCTLEIGYWGWYMKHKKSYCCIHLGGDLWVITVVADFGVAPKILLSAIYNVFTSTSLAKWLLLETILQYLDYSILHLITAYQISCIHVKLIKTLFVIIYI